MDIDSNTDTFTTDSKKVEQGCRMISVGVVSFCGFGLADGHVRTFWLLLYHRLNTFNTLWYTVHMVFKAVVMNLETHTPAHNEADMRAEC